MRANLAGQRRNAAGSCFLRNMITFGHSQPIPHTHSRHPAATLPPPQRRQRRRRRRQRRQPDARINKTSNHTHTLLLCIRESVCGGGCVSVRICFRTGNIKHIILCVYISCVMTCVQDADMCSGISYIYVCQVVQGATLKQTPAHTDTQTRL